MISTAKDSDDLIPLKEFARRLGRNVEATRRRFGDIAIERRGRRDATRVAALQRARTVFVSGPAAQHCNCCPLLI